MPKKTASLSLLEKAAQQLAGEMGLEYVDTELVKEPGGRFLRIYIDQPGGITLEQLESYHRQIRSAADDIDYDYIDAEFILQDVVYFPIGHPSVSHGGVRLKESVEIPQILESLLNTLEGED